MKVIRRTKERILSMVLTFVMLVSLLAGFAPMEVNAESVGTATLKYEVVGGSGTMDSAILNVGEEFTLPAPSFRPDDGREFYGWFVYDFGDDREIEVVDYDSGDDRELEVFGYDAPKFTPKGDHTYTAYACYGYPLTVKDLPEGTDITYMSKMMNNPNALVIPEAGDVISEEANCFIIQNSSMTSAPTFTVENGSAELVSSDGQYRYVVRNITGPVTMTLSEDPTPTTQKIASLAPITKVDGKKVTFTLDPAKEYVISVIKSQDTGLGNLFNTVYQPSVASTLAKIEAGVNVLAKENFNEAKITQHLAATNEGQDVDPIITRAMSNVITGLSSYTVEDITDGACVTLVEVQSDDLIQYTTGSEWDHGNYYITYGAHIVFIPAAEVEGYDVKLDTRNYQGDWILLCAFDSTGNYLGEVSEHDVPITIPTDGFVRVFASEEFTVATGDAEKSEMLGDSEEEGYYYEITNFKGDTTITLNPVAVESVTIDTPATTTLTKAGESVQLTAAVNPTNAMDKAVTWSSSNPAVATVDENGKVTAVANGTAVITVTTNDGNKTASVTVTVAIPADKPADTPADKPADTPADKPADTPADKPADTPTDTPADTPTDKPAETPVKVTSKDVEKNSLKINEGLKVDQKGSTIKATWGKVSDADGYKVYVQYCGKGFQKTPVAVVKGAKKTSVTIKKVNGKKLDLKKNYKLYVVAYKTIDGKDKTLGKSITAHIVGSKNTKYTNVKKVNIKKTKYTLKVKKTATIKASTVLVNKNRKQLTDAHAKEFRYATSNKKVATVSAKGKITAVGKGKCTIYVYARNGYCKKVSVTVK